MSDAVRMELREIMADTPTGIYRKLSASEMSMCRLSAVASILAEVRLCLSSARMAFRSRNGLNGLTLYGVLHQILYGLAYSCLRWDAVDSPNTDDVAVYGVVVDHIEPLDYVCKDGKVPADVTSLFPGNEEGRLSAKSSCSRRCVKAMLYRAADRQLTAAVHYVLSNRLHRYSVSQMHVRLALSIAGVDRTVWTRLGFERIMDTCYLHTLMALNTTAQDNLRPPCWEEEEKQGDVPEWKPGVSSKTGDAEEEALNTIEQLWPPSAAADPTAASSETTSSRRQNTADIRSRFDFTVDGNNISVHKRSAGHNLFNDADLDPLRLLKAKLWSLARKHKVDERDARGVRSVLVLRVQLPLPGYVGAVETAEFKMKKSTRSRKATNGDATTPVHQQLPAHSVMDEEVVEGLAYGASVVVETATDSNAASSMTVRYTHVKSVPDKPASDKASPDKPAPDLPAPPDKAGPDKPAPQPGEVRSVMEDHVWPSVLLPEGRPEWKRVIPTGWLLRTLQHAVQKEVMEHFNECGPDTNEVPVIVLGILYEGAPGVDGVIAYGKCSRSPPEHKQDAAQITLTVERLLKVQTKCLQQGGERAPKEAGAKSASKRAKNPAGPRANLLAQMGKNLSLEHHDVKDASQGRAPPIVDNHVVVYDDENRVDVVDANDVEVLYVTKGTAHEAVHPLAWKPESLEQDQSVEMLGFVSDGAQRSLMAR